MTWMESKGCTHKRIEDNSFINRLPIWLLPLGIVVIVSATISGVWFSIGPGKSDTASLDTRASAFVSVRYSTLEELSTDADVVVIGTVNGIAEKGVDRGAEGDGLGIPYTIYEVEVEEVLKGEVEDTIYVHRYRPGFFVSEMVTKLTKGETVALYLRQDTNRLAPTITYDTFYAPLTFDNSVFDVSTSGAVGPVRRVDDEAVVTPRGVSPSMFSSESTFKVSDLREAIEPESGDVEP